MEISFDIPYLIIVVLFSCVGFVMFSYGKKMQEFLFMLSGLLLLVYGYFVDTWITALIFGIIFSGIPYISRFNLK